MRKILLTLACLFLSFTISNALYRHQIGKYDWDYRTIGDLDQVHFLKFQVAFSTKDNFIGVFSAVDGKIAWSKDLSSSDPKILFGNSAFIVLDSNSRTILTLEYTTGTKSNELQIRDIPVDEKILDFFYEVPESGQNTRVGVLTSSHVYYIKGNNLEFKEPNNRGLKHIRYSSDKDIVSGISSDKTKGTCIHKLPAKGQAANSEKCFEIGAKDSDVQVHRNQLVVRGPSSVTVVPFSGEGKGVSHSLTSSARSVFLDKCGVLVTEKGDKCQIYSAKNGAFELITSVDGSLENVSFGCNQASGDERYLVATEVTGTSTIKVKRISLSSPSEPHKILLNEVAKFSVGKIEQVYTDNLGFDSRVIIKTQNLQILMVRDQKVAWKHEDSLSEIKQIQFFDYESLEEKELNPYFENLDEHHNSIIDLPTDFILRVKAQTNKLVHGVNNLLKTFSTMRLESLWEADPKFDKHNGLQKIIIAITERNTVFGIDSKTGEIFWEKIIDSQWTVEGIFKTKRNTLVREALLYLKDEKSKRSKLIHLNPLDGQLSSEEEFDRVPHEFIPLHLSKSTAFILVFGDNTIEYFPRSQHEEISAQLKGKDFSIYRIEKNSVTGYQLFGKTLVQTWNFNLPSKEEVLRTSNWSYDIEETEFKTVVPEDRKVIYKFSDSNNFALLSKSTLEKPHVNLYIINGATGRVLHSRSQNDVDFNQPINLLYDENAIFVSYFNTKNLQTEIWVTELYKSELESSFTSLLERYFFEQLKTDEEAKYSQANAGFIAFSQKYFFLPGVKTFGAIETIHGVTKKNLIIVTSNDQIYSLDRGLLSTRRQLTVDGKAPESDPTSFGSSELPPYVPVLPISNQKFLSYFKRYSGLRHVEASPTRFESTSLTFIYGHDIVYFRVAPEKEFDMLSEDFKYQYLVGSIALILIGLVVVQRLSKKQKLLKIFNN